MRILITEKQFERLFSTIIPEGINYSKAGDWGVDVNINNDQEDSQNVNFDTRLFGTANSILNGDSTRNGRSGTLKRRQESFSYYLSVLEQLKVWVENGRKGNVPDFSGIGAKSAIAIKNHLNLDDEGLLSWIDGTINRISTEQQIKANKYNRATSANPDEKIARYNVGVVPGTNIKVICLFDFNDFNVSDILKNGYMRQNDTTDEIFSLNHNNRPKIPGIKGASSYRNIPVTYNGQTPDIQGNFSLNGMENDKDHFNRISYGVGDSAYHSVSKFIDKSINYAQYALKKEDVKADYILCAPSSSKFNIYYAKRLQDKTGIPFINGFFEKRLINVHFDRAGMEQEGISEESINSFEKAIKSAAMKEITNGITAPIRQFVRQYWDLFKDIQFDIYRPARKRGRQPKEKSPEEMRYSILSGSKVQQNQLYQLIATPAFKSLNQMIFQEGSRFDDNTSKYILNNIGKEFLSSVFDAEALSSKINNIINRNCLSAFTYMIRQTAWLIAGYHDKLLNGFKPNFDGANFKVTKFSKNVRKYLKGAFVIADAQLNKDKNLFTRYIGKKYLIFDEDMNSGATLAMLGDALMDYGIQEQDITCLVNGFSSGGF